MDRCVGFRNRMEFVMSSIVAGLSVVGRVVVADGPVCTTAHPVQSLESSNSLSVDGRQIQTRVYRILTAGGEV